MGELFSIFRPLTSFYRVKFCMSPGVGDILMV